MIILLQVVQTSFLNRERIDSIHCCMTVDVDELVSVLDWIHYLRHVLVPLRVSAVELLRIRPRERV